MNGTDYSQLLIFHAIAMEGSISGAARRLEMTAPSVSHALKSLERSLHVPLFNRTTWRIELTEAGEQLRQQTKTAISELSDAFESVKEFSATPKGTVRLTTPRFAFQLLLEPYYEEFCRRYPEIQLEISINDATVNLITDGMDIGIRFGDKIEPGMVAKPLTAPSKEGFFCSPSYAKTYGIPKTIEDLANHKLIQYRYITSKKLVAINLLNKGQTTSVTMPFAMVVNDTDLMINAAKKGLGIGRMVESMLHSHFKEGTLIPILEEHWYPFSGLFLYFQQHSQKARKVRVLIDFILEKNRKL
tara:strand:+ start:146 stop:1048 length:903 start_codon:yes stop_codon:yes gene_type:complete